MSVEITVQICAYNSLPLLRSCLNALNRQTFDRSRFEVILVDDGSTDGSAEAAERHDATFSLRVLRQAHAGLATARNTGIRASSGKILLFMDHDTLAHPSLLAEHWASHGRHPRAIVSGWVRHVEAEDAPTPRLPGLRDLSTSPFWTSNVSVGRSDVTDAGLFDERFTEYGWEDLDLGDRLLDLGLVRCRNWRAIVDHVKPAPTRDGLDRRLARAGASGRSAVIYLGKRPTLRTRQATGLTRPRKRLFAWMASAEPRLRRIVNRAPGGRLRGVASVASALLAGIQFYRSASEALAEADSDDRTRLA